MRAPTYFCWTLCSIVLILTGFAGNAQATSEKQPGSAEPPPPEKIPGRLAKLDDKAFKKLSEAGFPVTIEEVVERLPSLDDKANQAVPLIKAADWLSTRFPKSDWNSRFYDPISSSASWNDLGAVDREKLNEFLSTCEPVTIELSNAAQRPGCRFPVDYSKYWEAELPHLAKLRTLQRFVLVGAAYASAIGDTEEYVRWHRYASVVAGSLRNEPVIISQIVAANLEFQRCKIIERGLHALDLREPVLLQLLELYGKEPSYTLWQKLAGYFLLEKIKMLDKAMEEGISKALADVADVPLPSQERDELTAKLKFDNEQWIDWERSVMVVRMAELWATQPQNWEGVAYNYGELRELRSTAVTGGLSIAPGQTVIIANTSSIMIANIATQRVQQVALAAELYRLRNGQMPVALENLVPTILSEVPIDPFTGQPLVLRERKNDYLLLSLGQNKTDDDGAHRAWNKDASDPFESASGDIAIRLRK